jgi:Putative Ig domain
MLRGSSVTARLFTAVLVFLGLSLVANLVGCGGSSTPTPTGITIQGPAARTIDPGDSVSFTAAVTNDVHNAGVSWTLTGNGCMGAACGALSNSSTTGVTYTAPATVTTAFTVTITVASVADSGVTTTIMLSVPANPSINTSAGTLPGGVIGTPYSVTLAGAGGITPYAWSVTSGALPAGLTLGATTGTLSGTPTSAGNATFTVTLTDSGSPALTATATYTIATAYPAIVIGTAMLPSATFGTPYTAMLSASGGSGTGYTWAVTSGTGLSAVGLSLSPTGLITGTPNAAETGGVFVVTVTDSAGNKASATLSLTVVYPAITISPTTLPNGTVGTPYAESLAASGGSGTGYIWAVTSGTGLSTVGLTLAANGAISGKPTTSETSGTFVVTVTDSALNTATATISLSITVLPTLTITTTSLPSGTEGTTYTAALAASGGSGTYTWAVTSGTGLSAVGLALSSAGAITGTPNAGEPATPVTIQVTDSDSNTASATLNLTVTAVVFQGQVLSGTAPVSGATIQLYTVGSAGNGSAATPMLTQTVVTDGIGMFNLAGFYTCGQDSSGSSIAGTSNQVYLVATGGSTSLTTSTDNGALVMVTAVGPCSNLASTPFFTINELTTAAAAWALAPFSASATNIGGSATNVLGITNAFLDAALLANPATGAPATLPAGLTVETGKLAAFADVLNTCTASADGSGCSALFAAATPAGGTAPVNSFNAALNIVQNPGQNVAAVYAVIPTTVAPPFATTLTESPNDWTMSLTVTGGGLFTPTALGIDSLNNIWVAGENGPLSAFNAQGTPLSSTGYGIVSGVPITSSSFGLAIDSSNNIWVTNEQNASDTSNGSVIEFYGVNNPTAFPTGTSPQPVGCNSNVYFPVSIAAATNGNIYVANTGEFTSVTICNSSGSLVAPALAEFVATSAGQNSVAIDTTATNTGFWLSDNAGEVEHFSSSGELLVNAACCEDSLGIATDSAGDLWIADYLGGADNRGAIAEAVTDTSGNTSVPIEGLVTGGIDHPQAVAVDAAQNVWFANKINGSITELAGVGSTLPVATALSPSTGVYGTGGYGLDGKLGGPYSLLPDRSGNLWVSNESANTLTMFFGLAAPTVTPLQPVPTAP